MIVEPNLETKNAVIKRPSVTAIETPMHGLDRFLLTLVQRVNGKSSQVGSKPVMLELALYFELE
jgi:hypothetical protein